MANSYDRKNKTFRKFTVLCSFHTAFVKLTKATPSLDILNRVKAMTNQNKNSVSSLSVIKAEESHIKNYFPI